MSDPSRDDLPIFLRWIDDDRNEEHVFIRSDWVMDYLFDCLSEEDAVRVWTKMIAVRVRAEEGDKAAEEFLEAFGIPEH